MMTNNRLIEFALFFCTLLSGFYAGTGFFTAMGGNPAIKLMSDKTFAEYWQYVDFYMSARMKIFGPLLLLTLLFATIILFKDHQPSFYCMLTASLIIITDVIFTLGTNHPLNHLIQSWDLNNLPSNVQDIKWRVARAFDMRALFMIGCFVMVLLAVWFRKYK
jgi:hypothetical protein